MKGIEGKSIVLERWHHMYEAVASRIELLTDEPVGSEGAKELKFLTNLVVDFERGSLDCD